MTTQDKKKLRELLTSLVLTYGDQAVEMELKKAKRKVNKVKHIIT